MPNIGKAPVVSGVGPSGQKYEWTVVTPMEFALAMGGVPGLSNINLKKFDVETMKSNVEFNNRLLVRCVKYPKLILDGESEPEGDWAFVSERPKSDVDWLVKRVLGDMNDAGAAAPAAEVL